MIELLPNPAPHVVAFRIGGKVKADETQRVFDAINDHLDAHATVNLYAEIINLGGITLDALIKDTARSLGLLGHLRQLGRYAIVTDTKWIRTAAGIEGKLIPGLEVRAFGLSESDAATAWVAGTGA